MAEIAARGRASGASGLIFANLVDFDSLYGHRNDAEGFAQRFGRGGPHGCPELLERLRPGRSARAHR
jgi:phosphopentomutase